jgi:hypothetical protein
VSCGPPSSPHVSASSRMSSPSGAALSDTYSLASDFLSSPSHSRSNSLGLSFAIEDPELPPSVPQTVDTENSEGVPELSATDAVQHLFVDGTLSNRLKGLLMSYPVLPSLSLFFDNVHHLAFPYPVHRFRRRLSLPQSDIRSPHQTLVYAILAFACHFASGRAASQQGYFINKARSALNDGSGRTSKPRDYILAGSILARAVLLEGDASAASRLSLGELSRTLASAFTLMLRDTRRRSDVSAIRNRCDSGVNALGPNRLSIGQQIVGNCLHGTYFCHLTLLRMWAYIWLQIDLEVAFENGSSPNISEEVKALMNMPS